MRKKIRIVEVGPRDGLQNEKKSIPTDDKLKFIELLLASGIKNIETTSFVRADKIPQLSDSEELSKKSTKKEGVEYFVLTPNLKGYEKALEAGYKSIAIFGAASESFTKKNINKTIRESIEMFKEVTDRAAQDGIKIRGYISTVVACPYEGKIEPERVLEVCRQLTDLGVFEISLGETIGVAAPVDVENLFNTLLKSYSPGFFSGHFHDTYGMAIANVQKSLEMGITSFDSSAGGLGGCPYAKGASGNLATEDLVYLLESSGFDTGIDLSKLVSASNFIESKLDKTLISKTYIARKLLLA